MIELAKVLWNEGYINDPVLEIRVSEQPGEMRWQFKELDKGCTAAFGSNDEGLVSFYYHDPKHQEGFGGSTVVCGDRTFKGPWSSNADAMALIGFPKTLPVRVWVPEYKYTPMAYHMLLDEYKSVIERFLPGVMLVEDKYLAMKPQDFLWYKKGKMGEISTARSKKEFGLKNQLEYHLDNMLEKHLKYWQIAMFPRKIRFDREPVTMEMSEEQNLVIGWDVDDETKARILGEEAEAQAAAEAYERAKFE